VCDCIYDRAIGMVMSSVCLSVHLDTGEHVSALSVHTARCWSMWFTQLCCRPLQRGITCLLYSTSSHSRSKVKG